MNLVIAAMLALAAALAASGQLMLKLGATGATAATDFINLRVFLGLLLYGIGTIFWIVSLSRAPLIAVYSFTVLTFAFVYLGSVLFLGERLSGGAILGCLLILVGLYMLFAFGGVSGLGRAR